MNISAPALSHTTRREVPPLPPTLTGFRLSLFPQHQQQTTHTHTNKHMCLAIYKPADTTIPEEYFRNAFDSNPHGAGFAYNHPSHGLVIEKGFFSFKKFWKAFKEVQTYQAIVHFRFATHGKRNEDNCHPFPVGGDLAMIHNGIISIDTSSNKKRSDTWHFVEQIVKPFERGEPGTFLENQATRDMVEKYIVGSKLVFLHADGRFAIYHEKSGHWKDGVWYSNDSYSARAWARYTSAGWGDNYWESDWDYDPTPDASPYRQPRGLLRRAEYESQLEQDDEARFREWQDRRAAFDPGLSGRESRRLVEDDAEAAPDEGMLALPPDVEFPDIPLKHMNSVSELIGFGYAPSDIRMLWDLGGIDSLVDAIDSEWDEVDRERFQPHGV